MTRWRHRDNVDTIIENKSKIVGCQTHNCWLWLQITDHPLTLNPWYGIWLSGRKKTLAVVGCRCVNSFKELHCGLVYTYWSADLVPGPIRYAENETDDSILLTVIFIVNSIFYVVSWYLSLSYTLQWAHVGVFMLCALFVCVWFCTYLSALWIIVLFARECF